MKYINEILLNNDIEKLKYYHNLLNTDLEELRKLFLEMNNCYKSPTNKLDSFSYIFKKNNSTLIYMNTTLIKFLKSKLENYKLASLKAKSIMEG